MTKVETLSLSAAQIEQARKRIERLELETSHIAFTRRMFPAVEGTVFLMAEFHRLIGRVMDDIIAGRRKRVIINIPPGYGKTELGVINFVGRGFAVNPKARFIHTSFSDKLVMDNSSRIKNLVTNPEFQKRWPLTFKADSQAKGLWKTEQGGHFLASSSGAPITGFRAGYLNALNFDGNPDDLDDYERQFMTDTNEFTGAFIIDDPLKPLDAKSEVIRSDINDRWQNTFKSRLAHEDVPVVCIMQRLHVDDFVNHLIETSGEEWDCLVLPVLLDGPVEPIGKKNCNMIPHGLPDGPLWETKHTREQIKVLQVDAVTYSSQYMQSPIILGGNLFKKEYFGTYDPEKIPNLKKRVIFADTASKTQTWNDYSVFGCFGQDAEGNVYVLDWRRNKWEVPDLVAFAQAFWDKHAQKPRNVHGDLHKMVVEDKSSGVGLIQTLRRKRLPVIGIEPETDKVSRAQGVLEYISASPILIPEGAEWGKELINELLAFPEGKHDDQVDVIVYAAIELLVNRLSIYDQL